MGIGRSASTVTEGQECPEMTNAPTQTGRGVKKPAQLGSSLVLLRGPPGNPGPSTDCRGSCSSRERSSVTDGLRWNSTRLADSPPISQNSPLAPGHLAPRACVSAPRHTVNPQQCAHAHRRRACAASSPHQVTAPSQRQGDAQTHARASAAAPIRPASPPSSAGTTCRVRRKSRPA
ncbi:hypothetical protein DIQ79_25335 [Mycolicibacterium smegmatis]|nr:hypothetical protein EYS45_25205 [Mycolicibacterium smegmatis MC2 155]TBM43450.1 hypothetical protein DIQ86_18665 [Mycolicibacterium smegmatis]TBM47969.1 hypothetical protein DIQ85_25345 [Mycolicibacterium smegmatis]TBM57506.1 hypothetical protein DIQ83_25250 [Mycolicibacterium smegmatis]TBM65903.1 hypothetical protein DIQ82_25265 [Mycolicibacterium smegmatis]